MQGFASRLWPEGGASRMRSGAGLQPRIHDSRGGKLRANLGSRLGVVAVVIGVALVYFGIYVA